MRNCYYILRHGETAFQKKKKDFIYFWPDSRPPVPLTGPGKKKIIEVAGKIKREKIDLVFASDSLRTKQTAGIVGKKLGVKPVFEKRFRDLNLGVFQGKLKKDFYRVFPDPLRRFKMKPRGGESWDDVGKRVMKALKEIDKKYKNKRILIVSHGDPLWLLEGLAKKLTRREMVEEAIVKKRYIKTGEFRRLSFK